MAGNVVVEWKCGQVCSGMLQEVRRCDVPRSLRWEQKENTAIEAWEVFERNRRGWWG